MSNLSKVALRHTALGNRIVLARFGKDPHVALDTRDAMNDFFQTAVSYAFDGKMPEPGASAEISFGGGNEQFVMTISRTSQDKGEPSNG